MKGTKISREGKSKNGFFSGKGFYIALAISLVAVGGAAWIGVNSTMKQLKNNNDNADKENPQSNVVQNEAEWDVPKDNQVDNKKPDVPANEPKVEEKPQEEASPQQGFIMPLSGEIINGYSGDKVVKSKTLDEWVMHTGIDLKAKVSTPVKAASAGKVIDVRNDDMWGACVIIEHPNGVETHYYNLKSAVNVNKNQNVKLGDVIGSVGQTAEIEQAEEEHLHFGIKKNGEWVDPLTIIKK